MSGPGKHSNLTAEQEERIGYALYEYPLNSAELLDAIRRVTPVVAEILAQREVELRSSIAAEIEARGRQHHERVARISMERASIESIGFNIAARIARGGDS